MKQAKDYWTPVFEHYASHYPNYAERTVDWYPSGQMEITVRLDDRTYWAFDMIGEQLRPLGRNADNSEAIDISEQDYRERLAMNIRKKIYNMAWNQEELANRSGISIITINKYVNAKATPSAYNVDRIARALQCSTLELTK